MKDLKGRTVRGGFAKLCGQAASFVLRIAGMVVLARLLDPEDFGLVAMVTVVTGVFQLFTTAGLSSATVQKEHYHRGTDFYVVLDQFAGWDDTGIALLGDCARSRWLLSRTTAVLGNCGNGGWVLSSARQLVQHSALLQRQLRYVALTLIEILCLLVSLAVGIGMALGGLGYWAIVGMSLASPAVFTISVWVTAGVDPGDTPPGSWDPLHVELWRNGYVEWPGRLCRLQFGQGPSGPILGSRCPRNV